MHVYKAINTICLKISSMIQISSKVFSIYVCENNKGFVFIRKCVFFFFGGGVKKADVVVYISRTKINDV